MKRSKEDFKAELEDRLSKMFLRQYRREPKSRKEWIDFAKMHGSAVATRLRLEDEMRAAGVNSDVKH